MTIAQALIVGIFIGFSLFLGIVLLLGLLDDRKKKLAKKSIFVDASGTFKGMLSEICVNKDPSLSGKYNARFDGQLTLDEETVKCLKAANMMYPFDENVENGASNLGKIAYTTHDAT